MTRRVQLIRLVGACLCLLTSISFCHAFSSFQMRALVAQAGLPTDHLPASCVAFARHSRVLMLVPVVLLAVGIYRLFRDAPLSTGAELCASSALVLAFLLLVACILAWQVPYSTPPAPLI